MNARRKAEREERCKGVREGRGEERRKEGKWMDGWEEGRKEGVEIEEEEGRKIDKSDEEGKR